MSVTKLIKIQPKTSSHTNHHSKNIIPRKSAFVTIGAVLLHAMHHENKGEYKAWLRGDGRNVDPVLSRSFNVRNYWHSIVRDREERLALQRNYLAAQNDEDAFK